jgi:8-oxo-dGTP pyrophosphatase MutT (NUDIX family)
MKRIDISRVRERLAELGPPPSSNEEDARAAVAIILRERKDAEHDQGAEVLFIRRAEHPLDPWSGHMAFPGGRADPADAGDTRTTALRETEEELGLSLAAHGEPIGRLPDLPAIARGKRVGLVIAPHVFALHDDVELVPGDEVAEAIWWPLAPLARGEHRTIYPYVYEGRRLELPGHKVGDRIVWGLTYQMLETFFERLRGRK